MKPTSIKEISDRIAKLKERLIGSEEGGFCPHKEPLTFAVDLQGNPKTRFAPCYCGKPRLVTLLTFCGNYPETEEEWESIFGKAPPVVIAPYCKVYSGFDYDLV